MNGKRLVATLLALCVVLLTAACGSEPALETATPAPTAALPTASAIPPTVTPERQPRVLFIGDSFTLGLSEYIQFLAASNDPAINIESEELTQPGTSLHGHWFIPATVPTIQEGEWTIVVLQDDLAIEGQDVQVFQEYARKFDAEIKNIGAETILYMPWEYDDDNPVTIEQIARAYDDIGAELGVKVAPVGVAWSRSVVERPGLDLYADDRSHAGGAGLYLTLAVLYATIFDEKLEIAPSDEIALSEEEFAFLQRIAWETVVDYQ